MPRLGWDMQVGSVAEWLKADGDPVEAGDPICTIAGDKATTELEALDSGILRLPPQSPAPGAPKKVALIATEIRKYSHAEHFVDRLLEGYGWHGEHHYPPLKLVALYVDQAPAGDLTPDRVRRRKAG